MKTELVQQTVKSLQWFYSIIVALAVQQGIRSAFLDSAGSNSLKFQWDRWPGFIAFVFTAVPFIHGMDLALARTVEIARERSWIFLLINFFVFFAESCILFFIAFAIGSKSNTNLLLFWMVLLSVDVIWGATVYFFLDNTPIAWCVVNGIAVLCVALLLPWPDNSWRLLAFMIFAIARTACDYCFSWDFYFPK